MSMITIPFFIVIEFFKHAAEKNLSEANMSDKGMELMLHVNYIINRNLLWMLQL